MGNSVDVKGGVFALGNFDGVHRGHVLVAEAAVARARELGVAAHALTFEPHPRAFFQPGLPPFRLTPQASKERLLKARGLGDVVTLRFDADLAQLSAQDFAEKILAEKLRAKHIVAGHDFAFGRGREGTMAKLAEWLTPYGIGITEIASLGDSTPYSSTRIRDLLRAGDVQGAAEMLGRDWSIAGTVIKGEQRGRTIGVPTANIALGDYLRPQFGVYAIRAGRVGETLSYKGVANIGVRPTVGGVSENLEGHLFDFNEDIYGQEWEFALTRFLRPERKFTGLDKLKAQIAKDIEAAKQTFAV
ncbi:MAG: bifunctional riboflavin kinase/FAD synthetase [Alphaproteobacteria bacterium]|nr:bifunctional riboflavin kinase/FAD synthetase [Alphaproteobacteria bacterium]